jgi:hypothetical protein
MATFNNPRGIRYGASPILMNSEFGRRFVLRDLVRDAAKEREAEPRVRPIAESR